MLSEHGSAMLVALVLVCAVLVLGLVTASAFMDAIAAVQP